MAETVPGTLKKTVDTVTNEWYYLKVAEKQKATVETTEKKYQKIVDKINERCYDIKVVMATKNVDL